MGWGFWSLGGGGLLLTFFYSNASLRVPLFNSMHNNTHICTRNEGETHTCNSYQCIQNAAHGS